MYNRCVGKQRKRRSNNSNGRRRAEAPSSKVADARQRANAQAGRKRSKDAAERAQQRAEERSAAEQTTRTAARQRAEERAAAEAERSAAAAQREALQAASPLPRGQRLPSGWSQRCPDAPTDTNPAACAAHREELLAWTSEGLDAVHEADTIDSDEPDYEACWEGRTVRVHRRAVTAASAVLGTTERVMEDRGLRLAQPARPEVGLSPDGMRRVLMCVCDHDACGQTVPKLLEARCPSTNAILEYRDVEHGYICPAEACYAEMSRRGFDSTTDQHNAAWDKIAPVVVTRLGLEGDSDKDKPIYAPDIVRDNDGNLLAVRPRRPHRKTRRPQRRRGHRSSRSPPRRCQPQRIRCLFRYRRRYRPPGRRRDQSRVLVPAVAAPMHTTQRRHQPLRVHYHLRPRRDRPRFQRLVPPGTQLRLRLRLAPPDRADTQLQPALRVVTINSTETASAAALRQIHVF